MKKDIEDIITNSSSTALATTGPNGLNVVPISVWKVSEGEIFLYDFFMKKSSENIKAESKVAFTCWKDFVGVQIKAEASYETTGADYDAAVLEMKERFPDRVLAGLIRLVPTEVYDVAPGASGENLI